MIFVKIKYKYYILTIRRKKIGGKTGSNVHVLLPWLSAAGVGGKGVGHAGRWVDGGLLAGGAVPCIGVDYGEIGIGAFG